MNRTDRLYALVEELRAVAPRPRTAEWLAARFEVSTRTIERDLSALQQSGVPIYATPGRRGGYAIDAAHTLPPVNFTAVEATAVAVALADPRATPFTAAARAAMLKLMAAMAVDDAAAARELASRVRMYERLPADGSPSPSGSADDEDDADADAGDRGTRDVERRAGARSALESAIVGRRVTRLSYIDREGATTVRVVEPVAVAGVTPNWYLVAWCRLREDYRSFRLDRVLGADITDEVAPMRADVADGPPGLVGHTPDLG